MAAIVQAYIRTSKSKVGEESRVRSSRGHQAVGGNFGCRTRKVRDVRPFWIMLLEKRSPRIHSNTAHKTTGFARRLLCCGLYNSGESGRELEHVGVGDQQLSDLHDPCKDAHFWHEVFDMVVDDSILCSQTNREDCSMIRS